MKPADLHRPGAWRTLFDQALHITDHLAAMLERPFWTFGGGTVLMLRFDHRFSKDIDLFVPDPQYLGHVSPRLSPATEGLTDDYTEAAEFIKLILPTGEIDVVVGEPLTDEPFEIVEYEGRSIRVETSAEILAKKMYFRGDKARARDLFDLCTVADLDPGSILLAQPFFELHAAAFMQRMTRHRLYVAEDFRQIERISYHRPFDECVALAGEILGYSA